MDNFILSFIRLLMEYPLLGIAIALVFFGLLYGVKMLIFKGSSK